MTRIRDHLVAIRKAWSAAIDAHYRYLDAARKRRKYGRREML